MVPSCDVSGVQTAEELGVLFPRRLPYLAGGQEVPGAARDAQDAQVVAGGGRYP